VLGPALGLSGMLVSRNVGIVECSCEPESSIADCFRIRRDRMKVKTPAQTSAKPTTPPTTPPAIAPMMGEDDARAGICV
jgi:hypothetical protein